MLKVFENISIFLKKRRIKHLAPAKRKIMKEKFLYDFVGMKQPNKSKTETARYVVLRRVVFHEDIDEVYLSYDRRTGNTVIRGSKDGFRATVKSSEARNINSIKKGYSTLKPNSNKN